jgi:hypothetical protein
VSTRPIACPGPQPAAQALLQSAAELSLTFGRTKVRESAAVDAPLQPVRSAQPAAEGLVHQRRCAQAEQRAAAVPDDGTALRPFALRRHRKQRESIGTFVGPYIGADRTR